MIDVKCSSDKVLKITEMSPFQGNLKKRKESDVDAMAASLKSDGLIMPFAVWLDEGSNEYKLLDGHGRLMALKKLAVDDLSIVEQDFPVIVINAENETEARKALLQIVSTYGKISKQGLSTFAAPVSDYTAPIIKRPSVIKPKSNKEPKNTTVIRIEVINERVDEVRQILMSTQGIKVL